MMQTCNLFTSVIRTHKLALKKPKRRRKTLNLALKPSRE